MLAVADLVVLSVIIVCCTISRMIDACNDVVWLLYASVTSNALLNCAKMATPWLIMVSVVDRYFVVCRPQLAVRYSPLPRARLAVCAVWIGSAVFSFPQFFEYTVNESAFEPSVLLTTSYIIFYRFYYSFLCGLLLPVSLSIFFLCRLARAPRLSYAANQNQSRFGDRDVIEIDGQRHLTSSMSVVVVVFLVFHVVVFVHEMCMTGLIDFSDQSIVNDVATGSIDMVATFLAVIVASVKVLIYSAMCRNFRRILFNVCCCGSATIPPWPV